MKSSKTRILSKVNYFRSHEYTEYSESFLFCRIVICSVSYN